MTKAVHLSRAILVCVGLLSGAIATAELGKSIELSSVSVLADRLRKEDPIDSDVLSKIATDLGTDSDMVSCRSDILSDVLTVHLHYLDRLDETENYEEWARGIERASAVVEDAIGCFPADGNLWGRLAMLRQAAVSLPAETAELMSRSVELSPAQTNVIVARFEVWRKMDAAAVKFVEHTLRKDLDSLLSYGDDDDIGIVAAKFSEPVRARANLAIDLFPEDRKDRVVEIIYKFVPIGQAMPRRTD